MSGGKWAPRLVAWVVYLGGDGGSGCGDSAPSLAQGTPNRGLGEGLRGRVVCERHALIFWRG